MTFDAAISWLDGHLGTFVSVTVRSAPSTRGNSGAVLQGELRPGAHEWGTIDSRGGALRAYDVGPDAGFFLLEGDFAGAELDDGTLFVELRELQVNVTPV